MRAVPSRGRPRSTTSARAATWPAAAGARPRDDRPGHAAAAAQEPHLFPPQVLRLSDPAQRRHDPQAGPAADGADRPELPAARPLFPFRPEKNLEEFFINRFGRELYRTFFKSYTEKVWGERCSAISAEWGAQRVKGLSILGALSTSSASSSAAGARHRPEGHRDLADRAIPLSQVRAGADVGDRGRGNRRAAAARSSSISG